MTAAPADAHSRSSNFRTAVASVAPQLPRVSVQAGAVGSQPFTITGTVTWTPYRSNSTAQILGGVAGAALFVTGGAVLVRRNRRQQQRALPTSGAESRSADKVLTRTR